MNGESEARPRIAYVISTFYPFVGGGETHALLLCKEMVRKGVDVFVVTRRTSSSLERHTVIDGVGVFRVPPVGFKRWGKYLMLLPVLCRLISTRKSYDMIVVSGLRLLGMPAMLAARWLGKKCVLRAASCGELSGEFIWGSPHLSSRCRGKGLLRLLVKLRNRLLLKANGFLAISEAVSREYRECGVPDVKIQVINNGTDTDRFRPIEGELRGALRKKLNIPEKKIFSYTGKLNKGKGLAFLVDVWSRVSESHDDVHLMLVGSGQENFLSCEEELRRKVREYGIEDRVTFTGYVENVHEYLQCSDVFLFPSENESLSNALIEALSCGVPCIASRVGGIPDTVEDRFNGRLLSVCDEPAWISAIDEVLTNDGLLRRWGKHGRSRVLDRNSMSSVADRHLEWFAKL